MLVIEDGSVVRIRPGDAEGTYLHSGDLFNYMRWLQGEHPQHGPVVAWLEEALMRGLVKAD